MEKQKYNNQKELEKLRNKKLLMPKMYSFIEVRELIDFVDKEFEIKTEMIRMKLKSYFAPNPSKSFVSEIARNKIDKILGKEKGEKAK